VRKLLAKLLYLLIPPEPYMVIEEIDRYSDQIVSMQSHPGELWIATRGGRLYRVKEWY
jgi:hypothetical protein